MVDTLAVRFYVSQSRFLVAAAMPAIVLELSPWDDYGRRTTFRMFLRRGPERNDWAEIGDVKILHEVEHDTRRRLHVPFEQLDASFCSLGQSEDYYESLHKQLGDDARDVMVALQDVALQVPERFERHEGLQKSLMRFPGALSAQMYARTLYGAAVKVSEGLDFLFTARLEKFDADHEVRFSFSRPTEALGRIVAIAGRNGCGKTQLLARLGTALSGLKLQGVKLEPPVKRPVVVISFNVFDTFTVPLEDVPGGHYRYYGLRAPKAHVKTSRLVHTDSLSGGLAKRPGSVDIEWAVERLRGSIRRIEEQGDDRVGRWRTMMAEIGVATGEPGLIRDGEPEIATDEFLVRLRGASSGHQFLVFIVTALVESVEANTVVLLDELETHLHPQLLSTTIRLLYDFLTERDAYAIVATHSPIVLQEIPARSIRLIHLVERHPVIKRFPQESFGGSLEDIVREGFGVDEGDRSYVTILRQLLASSGGDLAAVARRFEGLGLGARMLLRDLLEESVP